MRVQAQGSKFRSRVIFRSRGDHIEAGEARARFSVTSDLGPGLQRTSKDITAGEMRTMPSPISRDLAICLSEEWDSKAVWTIGPAIAAGQTASEVLQNYHTGLSHLAKSSIGETKEGQSAKLLASLESGMAGDAGAVTSASLDEIASKANARETVDIINALKVALASTNVR